MDVHCPNCGNDIRLVDPAQIRNEFGLSANQIQHAREQGKFPQPWIRLNNRHIYLRDEVASFVESRSRAKIENTVGEMVAAMSNIPPNEREAAIKLLQEEITRSGEPGRSSRGSTRKGR